jgi:hypothetical protein
LVLKIETFIANDDFASKFRLPKAGLQPTAADLNLQRKDEYLVKIFISYNFANFLHKFLRLSI